MLDVSATPAADADTVAVGVFDGDEPDGRFEAREAKGAFGHLALARDGDTRLLSVGLGDRDAFGAEQARIAAAKVVARCGELGTRSLRWDGPEPVAFVEGAVLATYTWSRKSSSDDAEGLVSVSVDAEADAVETARVMAVAQNAARDLQNAPANELTPVRLAGRAREIAGELGLRIDVLGREQIRALGMGAFSAVAQGAAEEPQLITLHYTPGDAVGPVVGLVGKAVTFDTGGISIKPAMKMSNMKFDMSGGAAVLEAVAAIARLRLPVRVIAVVGATNNDIGSRAVKPGDIVRARNGTTIEVVNTDAEGRLVLCDCLTHARDLGAERLIDVATLTGGIITTFGSLYAGLMSNDDAWCEAVRAAGDRTGEVLWRLPLHPEYADVLKGQYGDIINANEDRKATSIVGGEFLRRFVGDTPWVHMDIAGVGWDRGKPYAAKGGSGYATRTLVEVVRDLATASSE